MSIVFESELKENQYSIQPFTDTTRWGETLKSSLHKENENEIDLA